MRTSSMIGNERICVKMKSCDILSRDSQVTYTLFPARQGLMARNELLEEPAFPIWQPADGQIQSELDSLVYRSRLLGSDLRITNFGGGNTSAKIRETDPLTAEAVQVLWVKGSG